MCSQIHTFHEIKQHCDIQQIFIDEDFYVITNLDKDLGIYGWMCIVGACLSIFTLKYIIESLNDLCL